MSGVSITVDIAGLERAIGAVNRFAQFDPAPLMPVLGALGEMQTHRRVEEEKTSPDGAPWAPNREGTSILLRTGEHLRDSIAFEAGSNVVRWGSSWEFAHVHQNGATIAPKSGPTLSFMSGGRRVFAKKVTIPARPFVGVSAANAVEIEHVVTDFVARMLR